MSNTLTVTQLCQTIERSIQNAFPEEVWVEGVISSLKRSPNGHVYFDLVDPEKELGSSTNAVISVTLFSAAKQYVNRILRKSGGDTRMADGIKIRIRGEVNYYAPQGRVQLIMSLIDPEYTLGQMAADRQKLLKELHAAGLLRKNAQLQIPALPLRVGLITSFNSAAFADFTTEIHSSNYPFDITLFDCRVQGLDAVPTLLKAVQSAEQHQLDVLVIIRGGGARSDLVAFDHREVAFALANCSLPLITGIGHEIDRSVADEVAHTTVKTPTAAAGLLIDCARNTEQYLNQCAQRLERMTIQSINLADANLSEATQKLSRGANNLLANLTNN